MHKSTSPATVFAFMLVCSAWVSSAQQEQILARTAGDGTVAEAIRQPDGTTKLRITKGARFDEFAVELRDERVPEFVHPIRFESIKSMSLSDNRLQVALIGDVDGHPEIVVVDRRSRNVVTELPVFRASMSPDGRLIAFEQFRQRDDESTARYSIVASDNFKVDGSLRHPPRAVFPVDSRIHTAHSDLYWVRDGILAFLDYDGTDTRLVVMEVTPAGMIGRLVERKLDPDLLVNTAEINAGAPPGLAIWGDGITALAGPGLTLRLSFNSVNIKVDRADISVWP